MANAVLVQFKAKYAYYLIRSKRKKTVGDSILYFLTFAFITITDIHNTEKKI